MANLCPSPADRKKSEQSILIADNDPNTRRLVKTIATSKGFAVFEALSNQEAIDLAVTQKPVIVVVGLTMPNSSGFALARDLRGNPEIKDVIIIGLTGARQGDKARAAGCDDYLSKPIEAEALNRILDWFSVTSR